MPEDTEVEEPITDAPAARAGKAKRREPEAAAAPEAEVAGAEADEASHPPDSPYDRAGRWYVVHTYAGYENKVKSNLESRISSMNMEDRIYEVVIPMEEVVEFKGGKKVTVQRKV